MDVIFSIVTAVQQGQVFKGFSTDLMPVSPNFSHNRQDSYARHRERIRARPGGLFTAQLTLDFGTAINCGQRSRWLAQPSCPSRHILLGHEPPRFGFRSTLAAFEHPS